ncbi:MAG: HypC/HybG/HupF family hydrogenase formation chaperone [Candidatus Omnitrophica bacterium]|nr:HypC/HybG/HupF family hydrogenase formation chaperone [Candidatus Omnitrophota bacterium]
MCLAIPAKIKKIEKKEALVDFGGVQKRISLGILSGVKVGDYVLIHTGFAIGKISKGDAEDTINALKELREVSKDETL